METKKTTWFLLVLIVVLAFSLRFFNIDHAPPGVYPDEAVNGIDAQTANDTGNYQWFYEANNGREGLFMNLIALCFKIFGISILSLKFPAIVCGTLTVLGTFLLAREIFRSDRIGIISAYLVATSFWAMNFSRISFRANMLPFVLAFSFYFLFKGLRRKKMIDFALGGIFFGLGLHTYIAFRIAPIILVVMLATLVISRKRFLAEFWKQLAVFVIFTSLIAAPMLYTFYLHPDYITSRTGNVSIMNPEVNQGHLVQTFFRSFGLSLVKYNIWGDQNWRHNFPPYAILDPIVGIAFTFGLIYSFFRLIRLLALRFIQGERHPKLEIYMFLLVWFFAMLVPEFMTAEGNPHALRSIGTLPAVFILAALTFEFFIRKSKKYTVIFQHMTLYLVILMMVSIGLFNSIKYHVVWAKTPEVAQSFNKNLIEISDSIKTYPESFEIYVVTESMQRIPIELFNWKRPNTSYVYPGQLEEISPKNKDNFIIYMTDRSDEVISSLEAKFPSLQLDEVRDEVGMSYLILR